MQRTLGAREGGEPKPRFRLVMNGRGSAFSALPLALLGAALGVGCPQLLDDGFESAGDAGSVRERPSGQDTTPPRVMRSKPADGEHGVPSDTTIEITFSEAMDKEATEAAYSSADLPRDRVAFSWRDDDTVLEIHPNQVLPIDSGTNAAEVSARRYRIELSSLAKDRAGNALTPLGMSFFTMRELTVTLRASTDRTLTGSFRNDGEYGAYDCQVSNTTICVGDGVSIGEPAYRGFMSFDLTALPADRLAVVAAELSLTEALEYGTPFDALGPLLIDAVSYAAIDSGAFERAAGASLGVFSNAADPNDTMRADVLSAVVADAAGGRSQYRLRFTRDSDSDGLADLIICDLSTAELRVTYRTR